MAVLINFKICDNAEECNGIALCNTGALSWDTEKKSIKINNSKCTSCGLCEKGCEVYAIKVAKTDGEYNTYQKEIDDDPRKLADLYIDRFGAQPILPADLIGEEDFEQHVLRAQKLTCAEFFQDDTIECMIKSIPIKELLQGREVKYRKVRLTSQKLPKKYKINKLPALLFFGKGKLLGKVEGYYTADQAKKLKKEIAAILA